MVSEKGDLLSTRPHDASKPNQTDEDIPVYKSDEGDAVITWSAIATHRALDAANAEAVI